MCTELLAYMQYEKRSLNQKPFTANMLLVRMSRAFCMAMHDYRLPCFVPYHDKLEGSGLAKQMLLLPPST